MVTTAEAVRMFVLEYLERDLLAAGQTPESTPDDFDLLAAGVIDSFGIVDLISTVEQRFGVTLNFKEVDPDTVTVVGPLSTYVAELVERQS